MQTHKRLIFIIFKTQKKAQQCQSPKFSDVNSFSTQDAKLNTETSYSVQFRVKCANNAKVKIRLLTFYFIPYTGKTPRLVQGVGPFSNANIYALDQLKEETKTDLKSPF